MQTASLAGKWWLAQISVLNSLQFAFYVYSALFSEILKLLTAVLACEGDSKCAEISPPSQLPPLGTGPILFPLSLFIYFFLFSYCFMWRLACLFGNLRSSASVQDVFCRSCSRYIFICEKEDDLHILLLFHLENPPPKLFTIAVSYEF